MLVFTLSVPSQAEIRVPLPPGLRFTFPAPTVMPPGFGPAPVNLTTPVKEVAVLNGKESDIDRDGVEGVGDVLDLEHAARLHAYPEVLWAYHRWRRARDGDRIGLPEEGAPRGVSPRAQSEQDDRGMSAKAGPLGLLRFACGNAFTRRAVWAEATGVGRALASWAAWHCGHRPDPASPRERAIPERRRKLTADQEAAIRALTTTKSLARWPMRSASVTRRSARWCAGARRPGRREECAPTRPTRCGGSLPGSTVG